MLRWACAASQLWLPAATSLSHFVRKTTLLVASAEKKIRYFTLSPAMTGFMEVLVSHTGFTDLLENTFMSKENWA